MLIRGVVDDELGNDPEAATVRLVDKHLEVFARAVLRVDVVIIGNVIAVILTGRRVERQEPDGVHPQVLDVVQLLGEPGEVAYAIVVSIIERPDVYLINDSVLVPKRITRRLLIHL